MAPRVIRVPRQDAGESFVLIYIESSGSSTMDLKLVGTEGTAPFVLHLKQKQISALRSKNSSCTEDEWTAILESIFLGAIFDDEKNGTLNGVEIVASVEEDVAIDVIIRKRISGITQRLGSLQLAYDEAEAVELFDWCGLAIESTSTSAKELQNLKSKFQQQEETVTKLNVLLEDLLAVKASHEVELLEKFRDLLNEKKSKIRDQERLLSDAKVNPSIANKKVKASQAAISGEAGPSRSGKRKNNDRKSPGVEKLDDGLGDLETMDMDVDNDQAPNDSEQEEAQTTDEDETASEDEDVEQTVVKPPARGTRRATAAAKNDKKSKPAQEAKPNIDQGKHEAAKTPPPRELPFKKKPAPASKPADQDGDETESDDEL